ncbi:hypothetical protein [Vibrio phage RYC]|nr:hypothetical protein [Vibrio phage RYC]
MYLNPFEYKHADGNTYLVECEVDITPELDFGDTVNQLEDYLIVQDLLVLDEDEQDVTDCIEIPTHAIIREIELSMKAEYDLGDLTMRHISEEASYYQEEGLDGTFDY